MVAILTHRAPKLGRCMRCYVPKAAVTEVDLQVGNDAYVFRLCEQHADRLQLDLFAWTRVGEIVLPVQHRHVSPRVAEVVPDPVPTAARNSRVPLPAVATAPVVEAEPEEPAPTVWPESVPQSLRDVIAAHPGVRHWRLTRKARERADEHGVDLFRVLLAAEAPFETEPSQRDPQSRLHIREGVVAVVEPRSKTVLTVFRKEEYTRGKQNRAS